MKTNAIKKMIAILTIILFFFCCSTLEINSLPDKSRDYGTLHIRGLDKNDVALEKIKNWENKYKSNSNKMLAKNNLIDSMTFDLKNLYISSVDGVNGNVIIAFSNNNSDKEIICEGFYSKGDTIVNKLIVNTQILTDSTFNTYYYDAGMNPIIGFNVNKNTGQTNRIKAIEYLKASNCNKYFIQNTFVNGQKTSACMADVYTNKGWVSVWISVQTAFIPQTIVGIALACAIDSTR
jgi:hypothetical protein